jgi:hypothetical protein
MGAVAHPAANRNALEFFRAVFEGKVLGIDLQMMVAMLLENRMFNVVQYVLAIDRHPNTCTASLCDFCPVAQGIDCYSNPVSARASNGSIAPPPLAQFHQQINTRTQGSYSAWTRWAARCFTSSSLAMCFSQFFSTRKQRIMHRRSHASTANWLCPPPRKATRYKKQNSNERKFYGNSSCESMWRRGVKNASCGEAMESAVARSTRGLEK